MSKEDVWPLWIGRHVGRVRMPLTGFNRKSRDVPHAQTRSFMTMTYTGTARVVCRRCNNGWMAALERAAAPIIKRMWSAKITVQLSAEDQTTLAVWAFKTALMLQFALDARTVPDAVYHEFYATRLPVNCVMFVARYGSPGVPVRIAHGIGWHLGKPPTPPRVEYDGQGYGLTFAIEKLVVQLIGYWMNNPRRHVPMVPPPSVARYIQPLWPPLPGIDRIIWPPPRDSLTVDTLQEFCLSIGDARPLFRPPSPLWTPPS